MAKDKTQVIETRKNERIFYYEVLGIILIITSMLAIAKLGLVGTYLSLIIKVLFGDWYFLIILFILLYVIRCILVHKMLKIYNIRYLGLLFVILSLILLSHFSFHSAIEEYDGNLLIISLKLYFNYFKSVNFDAIVGGGIIGSVIFYVFLYLFSKIGVIILSILLIFLGIVFLSRKTVKDFCLTFVRITKAMINIFKKSVRKFKKLEGLYDDSYQKVKIKYHITKVNNDEIYENECHNAKVNVELIKKILNNMNVFYSEISYLVCRNVTIYFIKSYYQFSYSIFSNKLRQHINNFMIKYDQNNNELIVETKNLYQVPLRISEIEEEIKAGEMVFGIDDRNELLKLEEDHNSLMLFGKNVKLITDYIDAIIIGSEYLNKNIEYEYLDLYETSTLSTGSQLLILDNMITKLNNRINEMNEYKVNEFEEYLQIKPTVKYFIIIVNGIDKIVNNPKYKEKLLFLIENSKNSGYRIIFSSMSNVVDADRIINQAVYKIYFDSSFAEKNKYVRDLSFDELDINNEGYLSYKSIVIRMTLLKLGKEELKK